MRTNPECSRMKIKVRYAQEEEGGRESVEMCRENCKCKRGVLFSDYCILRECYETTACAITKYFEGGYEKKAREKGLEGFRRQQFSLAFIVLPSSLPPSPPRPPHRHPRSDPSQLSLAWRLLLLLLLVVLHSPACSPFSTQTRSRSACNSYHHSVEAINHCC